MCLLTNCLLGPRSDRIPVSIVQTILTQDTCEMPHDGVTMSVAKAHVSGDQVSPLTWVSMPGISHNNKKGYKGEGG